MSNETGPVVFPRDAIITASELAAVLRVSVRTIERMDLPTIYVGRAPRYLYGQILDTLASRAA